jgi:hypothetical protein
MKISMEFWWNGTDRGKQKFLPKSCQVLSYFYGEKYGKNLLFGDYTELS